jgi:ADP-heptose:LPS heptosyltransferase
VPRDRALLALRGSLRRRPRLVVLRALGLGDLLTALPALRALADAFPGHHRVLATPPALGQLALASGAVHEVAPAAPLAPLPPALGFPDVTVNLHGRGPQSHGVLLALRPRRLIAFASPEAGVEGPAWRADEHEVERWCRLLVEAGVPADPGRLGLSVPPGLTPADADGATIVHPGAADPARRWPAGRFAEVARAERAAGRAVLVTGSPREQGLATEVAELAGLPRLAVLAGRTSVLELARVVAAAGRVVSGDTGIAHLAVAVGTPSVTLFGPVPPSLWGPPAGRPAHAALWGGHTGDPHGHTPDPGLLRLEVDAVLDALARLPAPPPRSRADPAGVGAGVPGNGHSTKEDA